MKSEHAFIARLPELLGVPGPEVTTGIGDDAAIVRLGGEQLVCTVDACVEGVHFTLAIASFEDVGFRSLMAAASDLAAMSAEPRHVLSALIVPRRVGDDELERVVRGQRAAAELLGVSIVGGNISRGSELSVTTTVLGTTRRALLRGGARPGDGVFLGGAVGRAGAGFALLTRGGDTSDPHCATCVVAWRRPIARVDLGRAAGPIATACIDVSDGLAQDAGHLALASGVGLCLDAAAILEAGGAALAQVARMLARDPLELALAGGEDYALLVTGPDELAGAGFSRIGRVEGGAGVRVLRGGAEVPLPAGFDHGR